MQKDGRAVVCLWNPLNNHALTWYLITKFPLSSKKNLKCLRRTQSEDFDRRSVWKKNDLYIHWMLAKLKRKQYQRCLVIDEHLGYQGSFATFFFNWVSLIQWFGPSVRKLFLCHRMQTLECLNFPRLFEVQTHLTTCGNFMPVPTLTWICRDSSGGLGASQLSSAFELIDYLLSNSVDDLKTEPTYQGNEDMSQFYGVNVWGDVGTGTDLARIIILMLLKLKVGYKGWSSNFHS